MATSRIFLLGDGPAAHQMLQITASMLEGFPGIRVEHVNNPAGAVSNRPRTSESGVISIFAIRGANAMEAVREQMHRGPVIVVPLAESPAKGREVLEAATAAGAPTVALNEAGARNAALLAVAMFAANGDRKMRAALDAFRARQTGAVRKMRLPKV